MKSIVITAYLTNKIRDCVNIAPDDFIICADYSFVKAREENIKPSLIIGDFDSGSGDITFPDAEIIRFKPQKDDTDTLLACKEAIKRGYDDIAIVGGIGGRLDHTIANLQTLAYIKALGAHAVLSSGDNEAFIISNETVRIHGDGAKAVSLFAFGGECGGVCISGVEYPLHDATLTPSFPLGVSNKIISGDALVSVKTGCLLIVRSPF